MSQLDKAKEKLADLRRWQSYCVTSLIAVVAFLATQYEGLGMVLIVTSAVLIVLLLVAIVVLFRKMNDKYDEIGRL